MTALDSVPLWSPRPEAAQASQMAQFFAYAASHNAGTPAPAAPYADWHAWSVEQSEAFWSTLWDWAGVRGSREGGLRSAELSYAAHCLSRTDDAPAIIARAERGQCVGHAAARTGRPGVRGRHGGRRGGLRRGVRLRA